MNPTTIEQINKHIYGKTEINPEDCKSNFNIVPIKLGNQVKSV